VVDPGLRTEIRSILLLRKLNGGGIIWLWIILALLIFAGWILYLLRRIKEMAPPQHVMRFYGLEYALDTLKFKQITFIHPDKLNDPFDPNFGFETNFNDDYNALVDYVRKNHDQDYDKFIERLPESNWMSVLEQLREMFKNIRNSAFIFSTIEADNEDHPKDNLYMLSHYGNEHRGVAIEFDASVLLESVSEKNKKLSGEEIDIDEAWCKITYAEELPQITCEQVFKFIIDDTPIPNEEIWINTELAKNLQLGFCLKSIVWRQEREWRLMWRNDETRLKVEKCNLLDGAIIAIYFGCCIDDLVKDELLFESKRNFPNATIFQGKKKKGKFALEFEQLL